MFDYNLTLNRKVNGIRQLSTVSLEGGFFKKRQVWYKKNLKNDTEILRKIEEEFQERSEAAYKFGFEDGKKMGLQEGQEELSQVVTNWKRITDELIQQRKRILNEADELVVKLSVAIAKRILRQEVKVNPTVIRNIAKESLKLAEDRQQVSIRINPSDWNSINEFEQEMLSSAHSIKNFEIKEDDHVSPGGCIIESNSGIIDAQIDTQLEEITASLLETV